MAVRITLQGSDSDSFAHSPETHGTCFPRLGAKGSLSADLSTVTNVQPGQLSETLETIKPCSKMGDDYYRNLFSQQILLRHLPQANSFAINHLVGDSLSSHAISQVRRQKWK